VGVVDSGLSASQNRNRDGALDDSVAPQLIAEARLDIADAARIGGCPEIADSQYRLVIRSFPGRAYVEIRRRAELGLSAMQL
jgi:hypothetical protein